MYHHPAIPAEMDYRPVHIRQASINQLPVTAVTFDMQELLWAGTEKA
jgi:hypothetical protein